MEGLLLGALSYFGKNSNILNNNTNIVDTNNTYNSDLDNSIKQIEANQAKTLKTPEFFQQFDSLSFDNLSKPVGINESYATKNGYNYSLQKDINFKNGYSDFTNSDMNYNVVSKEEFIHNNMIPSTSRRDTFINLNSNSRKYENLSGNNDLWEHKKEVGRFFEPFKDLSYVHGAPVFAGNMEERYIASFKNNMGNLPFTTDQRVLPGLEGSVSAPYPVIRVEPRNIDALRSEINRKVTYLNKPLETIKKGDIRANEGELTKYKLPSYRVITSGDLVANKFNVEGPRQTGSFVHTDTERGFQETLYNGGAYDSNRSKLIDTSNIHFSEPKRENFENDNTHAINAVNVRPVFTNTNSYTNYETERSAVIKENVGSGMYNNNHASYYIDPTNIAKNTMKQNNIIQDRNLGYTGAIEKKTYMFSKDAVLPITNRNTSNYDQVSNTAPTIKNNNLLYTDSARNTVRQTTLDNIITNNAPVVRGNIIQYTDTSRITNRETTEDNKYIGISGGDNNKETYTNYQDNAKITNRETTEDNKYIGISGGDNNKETYSNYQDNAKNTIRQTTLTQTPIQNIVHNVKTAYSKNDEVARKTIKETVLSDARSTGMYNQNQGYYNISDKAKVTIKDTTLITNYNGAANHNTKAVRIEDAERHMTINDKRQQTALGGRISNAKSDQIRGDINPNTVKFNNKRDLYTYVSNPGMSSNYIATPFNNSQINKKTNPNENNFYRIDPIYIDTLNENPLVNDLMHQKNINFDVEVSN